MEIGVCCGVEKAGIVEGLGFNYVEESLSGIAELSDESFERKLAKSQTAGIPVSALNCFFKSDTPLFSDNYLDVAGEYALRALSRAAALGAKICVIGSGKARSIPEGMTRAFAEERFIELLRIIGKTAEKYNICIAIEPLNKSETNFITTVGEAYAIAKKVGLKNVGTMIDFHHFSVENESGDDLTEFKDLIFHAHIARGNAERCVPNAEDKSDLKRWAELLRKIDYKGMLSIEARYVDFKKELSEGREYLREFFQ
ncbi:MAG: sugar phosphate isomerase/epimerase [Clostridia bacterium]|nr:sugar phosphate isomerase/epimerase [Clostridia bacterium]